MKTLLATALLLAAGVTVRAQQGPSGQQPNALKFETMVHDFGTVYEGTMATFDFKFTNTSGAPVALSNVQASCGCTTPKWPREPIGPGESAVITAQYNSTGRPGSFHKTITVYTEGGNQVLTIQGNVVQKPEKPKSPVIVN
jgi:hypothetical protein